MGTWRFTFAICGIIMIIMFSENHCQDGLNPGGRNVCKSASGIFKCCHGWGQRGDECSIAICEGHFTCMQNEVCVRPNECRCRHGYFGATCDMKCPPQFWGPDCKGPCLCHPNGRCDDVSGACTCQPNRWGPRCAGTCRCGSNGRCDAATGRCRCAPGWYGRTCHAPCPCSGSPCDQLAGRCQCRERTWGARCERTCQCAPHGRCVQPDGACVCQPGFRGRVCREPCPAGLYGQNCRSRCGHCKAQQPCKVMEGRCVMCERGWNGTRCDQMCTAGFFGEHCREVCPRCKDGHFCNRVDGKCSHCNPGWMGDRCDNMCPSGRYGQDCANECNDCFNGTCHSMTGECVCDPGYHRDFCNVSCSAGKYGVNCSQTCSCHENNCNTVSGACILQPNQRMGVMAAGVLVFLLLVLLFCLLCCCCVCKRNSSENKAEHRLCGGLTRITTKLPRVPLRSHKLPNVLVSHHDAENSLECSFIEPPSVAEQPCGSSRGSYCSADTAEDSPGCPLDDEVSAERGHRVNETETTILADDDYADDNSGDGVSDEETSSTQDCGVAGPTLGNPSGLVCLATAGSERPCSQHTPNQFQRSNPDHEGSGETCRIHENEIHKANGKGKPQPPDPSTKPKVSWLHGIREIIPENGRTSGKKPNKESAKPKIPVGRHEAKTPTERSPGRNRQGLLPLEKINGAVQRVVKQTSHFHVDRNASIPNDSFPKMAGSSCREALQPHVVSEAVSMAAAQLKAKTEGLSRSRSNGCEDSSQCQAVKKKPAPRPNTVSQAGTNAHISVEKTPLLASNNSHNADSLFAEGKRSKKGDHRVEKTMIKKPPRKKCQEGHIKSKLKGDQ